MVLCNVNYNIYVALFKIKHTVIIYNHLDRGLNWRKHIFIKRKQLGIQLGRMYWLLGSKSQLSTENKLLLYEAILKLIWAYDVQLWDMASNSKKYYKDFKTNTSESLSTHLGTSPMIFYIMISTPNVKDEIKRLSHGYADRMEEHPNILALLHCVLIVL